MTKAPPEAPRGVGPPIAGFLLGVGAAVVGVGKKIAASIKSPNDGAEGPPVVRLAEPGGAEGPPVVRLAEPGGAEGPPVVRLAEPV